MGALRLLRAGALFTLGDVVAKLALMGALALWMRFMTPAEFGRLEVFRTAMLVLATPLGLGLSAAVGRYYVDLAPAEFRALLSSTLATVAAFSVTLAVLLIGLPGGWLFDDSWRWGWLLVLAGASATAFQTPLRSTFVVQGRAGAHFLVVLLQSLGAVAAASVLLIALSRGAMGVLSGLVFGAAVATVLAVWLARRDLGWSVDRAMLRMGLVYSLPLIPHMVAHSVMSYADRVVLVSKASEAEAGVYGAAYLIASGLTILALSLNRATLATVYGTMKRASEGDEASTLDARRDMSRAITAWVGVVTWLAAGFVLLGPDLVRWILPSSYHSGLAVFPTVVWGLALHAAYLIPVNTLMYRSKTRLIAATSVACAVLNVALNLLLVPSMGGQGAALATLAAYGGLALLISLVAQRGLRVASASQWIARVGIAAAVVALATLGTSLTETLEPIARFASRTGLVLVAGAIVAQPVRALRGLRPG